MQCDTYNEHPLYVIESVTNLLNELETFVPIHYDEISVAFVSEGTICALHKQFLNNPDPTDVITFPADSTDEEKTGEICISVDEALKYTHVNALEDELTLYLVHGWLHLANYDDIVEEDRKTMRLMEQKTLNFLNTQSHKRVVVKKIA